MVRKYLLVAVDCLSRYLRVEPLKTKYNTETAQVFKKMIKHKQPEKFLVDDGTDFLGDLRALWTERGICLYSTFSEKKSAFAERDISSIMKNIIYRYLEEKWTYLYLDKLGAFVKTINSRVNLTIKLAPNKVTKEDVPRLLSLTANTANSRKPKFFIGDFVLIVKKEKTSGRATNSRLLTRYLKSHLSRLCIFPRILLLMRIKKLYRVNSIKPNFNYYVSLL